MKELKPRQKGPAGLRAPGLYPHLLTLRFLEVPGTAFPGRVRVVPGGERLVLSCLGERKAAEKSGNIAEPEPQFPPLEQTF